MTQPAHQRDSKEPREVAEEDQSAAVGIRGSGRADASPAKVTAKTTNAGNSKRETASVGRRGRPGAVEPIACTRKRRRPSRTPRGSRVPRGVMPRPSSSESARLTPGRVAREGRSSDASNAVLARRRSAGLVQPQSLTFDLRRGRVDERAVSLGLWHGPDAAFGLLTPATLHRVRHLLRIREISGKFREAPDTHSEDRGLRVENVLDTTIAPTASPSTQPPMPKTRQPRLFSTSLTPGSGSDGPARMRDPPWASARCRLPR